MTEKKPMHISKALEPVFADIQSKSRVHRRPQKVEVTVLGTSNAPQHDPTARLYDAASEEDAQRMVERFRKQGYTARWVRLQLGGYLVSRFGAPRKAR